MRGFEDTAWFPKTLKPSSSVAARRCEGAPIFAKGACGALVGTFSHQILGVKIRKLLSDLAHFILTPGVLVPSFPLPYITPLHAGVGVGRGLLGQYALSFPSVHLPRRLGLGWSVDPPITLLWTDCVPAMSFRCLRTLDAFSYLLRNVCLLRQCACLACSSVCISAPRN